MSRGAVRRPIGPTERRAAEAWNNGTPTAAMRILIQGGYDYPDRAAFLRSVVICEDIDFWAESGNLDTTPPE